MDGVGNGNSFVNSVGMLGDGLVWLEQACASVWTDMHVELISRRKWLELSLINVQSKM